MLILRKIFFYLFALIYLALCPLIILYSFGYIFKPGAQESIVKTGLISLSSSPPAATVYLSKDIPSQKTPAVIRNLTPGKYPLRIILPDYKPWVFTAEVEANKATVFDHILLIPDEWKDNELSPSAILDLVPVAGNKFLIVEKGPSIQDHFCYDWQEQNFFPIKYVLPQPQQQNSNTEESAEPEPADLRATSVFIVDDSPNFLILAESKKNETKFLWIGLNQELEITDISGLIPSDPFEIKWDADDINHIFTLQNSCLNKIDISNNALYPKFAEGVRGFGIKDRKIYLLKDDCTISMMDYDGNENILLEDAKLGVSIFGRSVKFEVEPVSKETIVFLGEDGQLLSNHLPYTFVQAGVLGFKFDPDSNRLLFWQKDKIGILDFAAEETDGIVFERGPELSWLFTDGKQIAQCFWAYESSHIIFRDGNKVFLLEFEPSGKPQLNHVVEVKAKTSIYYSEGLGMLYYIDSTSAKLASIEIVSKQRVIPAPFSQQQEEENKGQIIKE